MEATDGRIWVIYTADAVSCHSLDDTAYHRNLDSSCGLAHSELIGHEVEAVVGGELLCGDGDAFL